MANADLITIAVIVPVLTVLGLVLFIVWLIRREGLKKADKLENFYLSNPTKSVRDLVPDADLMTRKELHDKAIPVLDESQGIVT